MRRNRIIMGTGVSLDIPYAKNEEIFNAVFAELKNIDERFSAYKKDSELSRYQRGEIATKDLSPDMRTVMAACKKCEKITNGYFSANFAGQYNPTGYVKGWAIKRAGKLIKEQGHRSFCIGIGGDILAASDGGKAWHIGIQDPVNKSKILNMLSISNGAIATSGSYERGAHIINPKTGKPAAELLSISVTGPDIIKADVLATAAFAMGKKGIDFVSKQKGYRALAVTGEIVAPDAGRADTQV